jgi:Fe2+ or Zn2+ uptake regulation protein
MKYPLYNDELCSDLWNEKDDDYSLREDVRKHLLKIALDFLKDGLKNTELSVKIVDVIMIGSAANYNWNEHSDIDLHIVVDFEKIDCDKDVVKNMFDNMRSNWNKNHNIKIKEHDVEVYVQDTKEEPKSGASYSIKKDEWIVKPKKESPKFDKDNIKKHHAKFKEIFDDVIQNPSSEKLKDVLEKVYDFRKKGLNKDGEFSAENIVFKILRAQGYIDKIKEIEKSEYDKEISLNENKELEEETLYENEWLSLKRKGQYVYSHETRCNGKIVAVILYKRLGRDAWEYGVRKEITPAWSDEPMLSSLTGGVDDGDTPIQAIIKEIKEEAGYTCEEKDLKALGTCRGTKSCDTVYHLYALDVDNFKKGKETGEDEGDIIWISDYKDIRRVQCPIFYTMLNRQGL